MKAVIVSWSGKSAVVEAKSLIKVRGVIAAELGTNHSAHLIMFDPLQKWFLPRSCRLTKSQQLLACVGRRIIGHIPNFVHSWQANAVGKLENRYRSLSTEVKDLLGAALMCTIPVELYVIMRIAHALLD